MDVALASNVLLVVPFVVAAYAFFKDRKRFFRMLSAYLLLSAVVLGIKFALKVPRPGYEGVFDPYSFPSFHTAFLAALAWFWSPLVSIVLAGFMGVLRVLAGAHTWPDVVAGFLIGVSVPPIMDALRRELGKEADRQAFHMGLSALMALLLFRAPTLGAYLLALGLVFGAILFVLRRRDPVRAFLRTYDRDGTGRGAFALLLGVLLVTLIRPDAGWKAAFFAGYVDGLATLAGKAAGTRKKSILGFIGGVLGAAIAWACTGLTPVSIIVVPLVEFFTRGIDDNITVPLAVLVLSYV